MGEMEMTDQMWNMLMTRLDAMDKKIDRINQVRLWKAKVTGALVVIWTLMVPIVYTVIKWWMEKLP